MSIYLLDAAADSTDQINYNNTEVSFWSLTTVKFQSRSKCLKDSSFFFHLNIFCSHDLLFPLFWIQLKSEREFGYAR